MRPLAAEVVSDGTSGDAHVRITGRTVPLDFAQGLLADVLQVTPPDLAVTYDYFLGPDDRTLRLDITLENDTPTNISVDYSTLIAAHGDGVSAYVPPFGFDNDSAIGVTVDSFIVAARDLAYAVLAETPDILLFGTYQGLSIALGPTLSLIPGASAVTRYRFAATAGGPDGLARLQRTLHAAAEPPARLSGAVTLPSTADPARSWVAAWRGPELATLAPVQPDGSYSLELDPADGYEIQAFSDHHAASDRVGIDLPAAADLQLALAIPAAATALVSVATPGGQPEPARVSFVRTGDTPTDAPPAAARLYEVWGDNIGGVAYHLGAPEPVILPAGTYEAVASRGFSYTVDRRPITLAPGATTPLTFTIERVIDTTGWVSADFHVHAEGSHDSFIPLDTRALQAFTDDLDLPVITEHDVVGAMARGRAPRPRRRRPHPHPRHRGHHARLRPLQRLPAHLRPIRPQPRRHPRPRQGPRRALRRAPHPEPRRRAHPGQPPARHRRRRLLRLRRPGRPHRHPQAPRRLGHQLGHRRGLQHQLRRRQR
jgi:hypothetical protein